MNLSDKACKKDDIFRLSLLEGILSDTQGYEYIHMETFQADLTTLFKKAGHLNQTVINELIQKFPHTHSQMGGHSHKLTSKYYSQLTKAEIQSLYQLYQLDHELFGYEPDEYLSYASDYS